MSNVFEVCVYSVTPSIPHSYDVSCNSFSEGHEKPAEFKYDEVVRNKEERKRLHGGDCECCRDVRTTHSKCLPLNVVWTVLLVLRSYWSSSYAPERTPLAYTTQLPYQAQAK